MNQIHYGVIAHVRTNPFLSQNALEIIEDGALLIDEQGKIQAIGPRASFRKVARTVEVHDHGEAWLIPGMVDGHIHFPQFYAIAHHGKALLEWLHESIFPAEARFASRGYAKTAAAAFIAKLQASGTTTALVFGSQFPHATRALFDAAKAGGQRMIAGMTLMDRDGPAELMTPAEKVVGWSERLIGEIADEPLLDYAITPRFALSCSPSLLETCAHLVKTYPSCYVQTHINENRAEIQAVAELFPRHRHYADVYDQVGLLTDRTVLAHNIHPTDAEMALIKDRGCRVCHCPASNAFLGSGLFSLKRHLDWGVPVLVGTDIGAGTNFSIPRELSDVYKTQQLQHFQLGPESLLYLGGLAGAEALKLDDRIGNFLPGKDADFLVLDTRTDPFLRERLGHATSPEDQLFTWLMLAGPEHIARTVIAGRAVFQRQEPDDKRGG